MRPSIIPVSSSDCNDRKFLHLRHVVRFPAFLFHLCAKGVLSNVISSLFLCVRVKITHGKLTVCESVGNPFSAKPTFPKFKECSKWLLLKPCCRFQQLFSCDCYLIFSFSCPLFLYERSRGSSLGGIEILHDQQQSLIVLLAPHQDVLQATWFCSLDSLCDFRPCLETNI